MPRAPVPSLATIIQDGAYHLALDNTLPHERCARDARFAGVSRRARRSYDDAQHGGVAFSTRISRRAALPDAAAQSRVHRRSATRHDLSDQRGERAPGVEHAGRVYARRHADRHGAARTSALRRTSRVIRVRLRDGDPSAASAEHDAPARQRQGAGAEHFRGRRGVRGTSVASTFSYDAPRRMFRYDVSVRGEPGPKVYAISINRDSAGRPGPAIRVLSGPGPASRAGR